MKLKLITLVNIFAISSLGFAAEKSNNIIIMPSAEILQNRLDKLGLKDFAEKTNIVGQLAGQRKAPLIVAIAVEIAYINYAENLRNSTPKQAFQATIIETSMATKPSVFEALLKDHPNALEELKNTLFY